MNTEEILQHHNIRPTANRILVYRAIQHRSETFSLADVESWLPDMERSSIFRSLRLFTEHNLLHEIADGSGSEKYCLCRCDDAHHLNHIHFACTQCGTTYCLEDQTIPIVTLPQGFLPNEYEYIVKGICPRCNAAKPSSSKPY